MTTETPTTNESPNKRFSFYALASTITGVLSYLLIFFHSLAKMSFIWAAILAPISALIAIITGHKGRHEIVQSDGMVTGKKLAHTGLVLGYLYYAICIILIVAVVLGAAALANYLSNLAK
jgi:hypothetical protein